MIVVAEITYARAKGRNAENGKSMKDRESDGSMEIVKVVQKGNDEPELKKTRKNNRHLKYQIAINNGARGAQYYGLHKGIMIHAKGELKKLGKSRSAENIFVISDFYVLTKHSQQKFIHDNGINPQELREQIAKDTEGEKFALAEDDEAKKEVDQNVVALQAWLAKHGYKEDIEFAYDIDTFFTGRKVEQKKESVYDLLQEHPFILAEMNYLMDSKFTINELKKRFPNETPCESEIAFAKICEILQNSANNGNSFMPLDVVAFYARNELVELLNQQDEKKHEKCENFKKGIFVYEIAKEVQDMAVKLVEEHLQKDGSYDPFPGYAKINLCHTSKDSDDAVKMAEYYTNCRHLENALRPQKFYTMLSLVRCSKAEVGVSKLLGGSEYLKQPTYPRIGKDPIDILNDALDNKEYVTKEYSYVWDDKMCVQALKNAFNYRMSVIVGCAGSGKSTLVGVMTNILNACGMKTVLLAPSAMASAVAANKVREVNGLKACSEHETVHKFSKISELEEDNGSQFDVTGIEPEDCEDTRGNNIDFVIVDEMSMCTIPMFRKLLMSLRHNKKVHIVLVGDAAQLPAIGPQFFYQLADPDSGFRDYIPLVTFNVNHRAQGEGDGHDLAKFGDNIRNGIEPEIPESKKAVEIIDATVDDYFTKYRSISPNTMFIAADAKTKNKLNSVLMKKFLGDEDKREMIDNTSFCIGEKVIAIKNDYHDKKQRNTCIKNRHPERDINIYNGTIGKIKSYDKEHNTVMITLSLPDGEEKEQNVKYRPYELGRYFEPAYALTVHKAQGSQAKRVVFFAKNRMSRAMLYTAVTRAQQKITIVGTNVRDQVNEAANNPIKPGYTRLLWRFVYQEHEREQKCQEQEQEKTAA